ncbi:MAG TPA: tetratricopeptide repeat protein [Pyrinomonadaceae bacterium]
MGSKKDLLLYAVIGLAAFCAFANTLGHGFVYDDNRQILGNPLIQRAELYGKAMTSDVWAFKGGGDIAASNYFRPTFVAWMIINWRLFESSAMGWHAASVLLHVAVCMLLFAFLRRMGCKETTAAMISVLFAVHPVHVENVAWISGATDPLLSAFLLISLILAQSYARARPPRSSSRPVALLALSVATYLLAVGAKEVALFCAPLYWLIFRNAEPEKQRANTLAIKPSLVYVGAAIAFFLVRARVLGAVVRPVEDPVEGFSAVLSIPKVFVFYLQQIFVPIRLGPALPVRPVDDFSVTDVVLPAVISVTVFWGLWKLARQTYLQTFGLALFILTLLPVLNPGNFGTEQLVHDRYLYLPLAGMLMVIIPSIVRFVDAKESPAARKVLTAGFGIVVLALGIKTVLYNRVWSDSQTLWRYAVTIDPGASHVWHNLGSATQSAQESLEAFERSLRVKPNAVGFLGKARALIALGRMEEAIVSAREAIATDPAVVNAYSLFQAYEAETFALANLGRYSEAEASLKEARRRLPIYHAALTEKLAIVLYTQNRKPETLAELEAVRTRARSEFLPESKTVFLRLGMLYAEMGRKSEAKSALEEYLATTPDLQGSAWIEERRQAAELLRQVSTR